MNGTASGAVYVQTNAAPNEVIGFHRAGDGSLNRIGSVATGGDGDSSPHLTSQGSVALTGDGRHLLVTNAASDDLSIFSVAADGSIELRDRVHTGPAPKSVAERDGLVVVLNTGMPGLASFRLHADGSIAPVEGGDQALASSDADPAQVAFTPGGALVVTEAFRAEKGAAAASSYAIVDGSLVPRTSSVGNGRSEICWVVVTPDDRFAFTTNFADGAVSRFAIAADGSLALEDATAGIAVDGKPGLRDEDLSSDGLFLYAIDADGGSIYGWSVEAEGTLEPIGSWDGLPATVAGLAAS